MRLSHQLTCSSFKSFGAIIYLKDTVSIPKNAKLLKDDVKLFDSMIFVYKREPIAEITIKISQYIYQAQKEEAKQALFEIIDKVKA